MVVYTPQSIASGLWPFHCSFVQRSTPRTEIYLTIKLSFVVVRYEYLLHACFELDCGKLDVAAERLGLDSFNFGFPQWTAEMIVFVHSTIWMQDDIEQVDASLDWFAEEGLRHPLVQFWLRKL
jgi:hypothetical protein